MIRLSKAHGRRFPVRELGRFLFAPLLLTVLVVVLVMRPWRNSPPARENGFEEIRLVSKGRHARTLGSLFRPPSGSVWYTMTGARLGLRLRAENLTPGKHYILELDVDDTIYAVASYQADPRGRIVADTSLGEFAVGVCAGENYHPPRSLQGPHTIRFWLKLDGNPVSGTQRVAPSADGGQAAELPCHGNGDGDYRYVLLENSTARFSGTGG